MTGAEAASAGAPAHPPFDTFRHHEDYLPGEAFALGALSFTREEIIAFARAFDPQPFHLDEAAARASMLGGLAASGWQAAAALNGRLAETLLARSAFRGLAGAPSVKWQRPVRPDRPLAVRADVADVAVEEGTVTLRVGAEEAPGAPAITMLVTVRIGRHRGEPPCPAASAPDEAATAAAVAVAEGVAFGWYEDLVPGTVVALGSRTVTPEEARAFAARFDPLIAGDGVAPPVSGWHLGSLWMRQWVAFAEREMARASDPRLKAGATGPSPGMSGLVWPARAEPGVALAFETRIADKRPSGSRKDWGLVVRDNVARLPDGRTAMRFRSTAFVRRRPG